MANQYFSIGSPFAEFVSWVVFAISFVLVFSPFVYLGYRKWGKHLPVSWWWVLGTYAVSFVIYLVWHPGVLFGIDKLSKKLFPDAWWFRDALIDGGVWLLFGVLIGWPLLASYALMVIKPSRYMIVNLLFSILVTSLMLWVAWRALGFLFGYGFSLIHQGL